MDSMEQKRQGEEGKKEKNPTKQNQTAHTFTKKGRKGNLSGGSQQTLDSEGTEPSAATAHAPGAGTNEMAEDRGPFINVQPSSKEAAE